ncbi:MAG: hypothetical protein MPL62_04705, partial [Alphaproteobacteria bacterium]|nr:hypothetical protein [Alphaproteobacteria bacterium]
FGDLRFARNIKKANFQMFRAKHALSPPAVFLCNYMNMNAVPEPAATDAKIAAARRDDHEGICRDRYDLTQSHFDEIRRALADVRHALERHDREFEKIDRKFTVLYIAVGVLFASSFFGVDWATITNFLGAVR